MLKGIGASSGYGIGKAVIIKDINTDYSAVKFAGAEEEKARLHQAVADFLEETNQLIAEVKASAGDHEAEILEGHVAMLNDPFMLSQMEDIITGGVVAEGAVDQVCSMFIDMFSSVDDELTRQRASDIKDIKESLLRILLHAETVDIAGVPAGSILIAKDFTPSMTSQIKKDNVAAIITEIGGVTSHSAILARAMGIPAVLSVLNVTDIITDGEALIVDGFKGKVMQNPSEEEVREYEEKKAVYLAEKESLNEYFGKTTMTKSGVVKKVYGNIGKAEDAQNVLQNGGEGIGLFRTEFLFMDRDHEPTEQEQFEAYSTVAKAMDGKEVIIRTLDIGGDKAIDYLNITKEDNPFMGHRAIRYCLSNPDLFKKQLRAILRAAQFGDIKIMLPLVTTLEEVREAKALIKACEAELEAEELRYRSVDLGVMIETPAAALISDLLAQEVSFFSIGTNDLTGYTMAADRGNPHVANLYDAMQPSVLRAIEMTIKNAKSAGIMVGMCGEAAADERMIPMLIEWGLDEFSVTPTNILQTRKLICENE
ncbi:MAG: phosphoenolpyruvate--protein phosphotransferase [Lachnospiraceae bacterium]|nr:phosphoenolpyruvate--protein phosphotransferase [Lachnospiraceae bacterium]